MELFLEDSEKAARLRYAIENLPAELTVRRGFVSHLKQLMRLLAFKWEFADGCKSRMRLFQDELCWSENTVRNYIQAAEELGWLRVDRERRDNLGRQTTNRYWVDWVGLKESAQGNKCVSEEDSSQPSLNGGAPSLNGGAPSLNGGAPSLNGGAPSLNGGPYRYVSSLLSSSLSCSEVCVSSDEEHTPNSSQDEMQVAVGELCHRLPDSAAVQDAAARLLLDGWTPSDVRQIPLPKFWDDAPTPKQLVEQATLAKAKRVAKERQAEASRSEDSAGRAANKASRQKEAAHRQKKKLLRPQWERLDPADRRRRIQAEKPQLVGMSLAEELAMEVWMKEVNP